MRTIRHLFAASFVAVLLIILGSCTVREELVVGADGSGTASLSIDLNPVLLSYYSDLLTAMTGVPSDYAVFDLEQLAAAFEQQPSLELTQIERTALGKVRMDLAFEDVSAVGRDTQEAGSVTEAFSFERSGNRRVLTVRLDRAAVNGFLAFAPPESAMMTDFLFPPSDGSVSREEYQDELAWALEEYAPPDEVTMVLNESVIEVVVKPRGRIVDQEGGRIRGDSVVFRVPVLDVLTLSEERIYRVVFEP